MKASPEVSYNPRAIHIHSFIHSLISITIEVGSFLDTKGRDSLLRHAFIKFISYFEIVNNTVKEIS